MPDLPGCVAVGATREEVGLFIKGAIGLHLESIGGRRLMLLQILIAK